MTKLKTIVTATLVGLVLVLMVGCGGDNGARSPYWLEYSRIGGPDGVNEQLTIMPDQSYVMILAEDRTEGQLSPEFWEQLRIWQSEIPSFTHVAPTEEAEQGPVETLRWSSDVSGTPEADRPQRMLQWTREMIEDLRLDAEEAAGETEEGN